MSNDRWGDTATGSEIPLREVGHPSDAPQGAARVEGRHRRSVHGRPVAVHGR
jgi:hypothetical protein